MDNGNISIASFLDVFLSTFHLHLAGIRKWN